MSVLNVDQVADCDWAFSYYENNRKRMPEAAFPDQSQCADNLLELADEFDVFILDAFGVLNVGDGPVPGAPENIAALQKLGKHLVVLSNGATFNADLSQQKYRRFGFEFAQNHIISSRAALMSALKSHRPDFHWGVGAIPEANLHEFGSNLHLLGDVESEYDKYDGLILLSSHGWNMERHQMMLRSLTRKSRPLYIGNPDVVAPKETHFSIEPGYYAHIIGNETNVEPVFCGKPYSNAFDAVKTRLIDLDIGVEPSRIAMVGDTLHTDILGGAAAGFRTILVSDHGLFRGKDTSAYIDRSGIIPDYIIPTT
jgi:HAD superfamily hydrolase (TIGR01450 family)